MTIDGHGNIHDDSNGRFAGHLQSEGDPDDVLQYGDPGYFEQARTYSDTLAQAVGGEVVETGGGCTAVQVMLPAGGELLVTNGDASMPDGGDAVISVADLNDVDEEKVYELMGPLTPDQLATEVRRATQIWTMTHGHCDRDQLAADLANADPNGLLSEQQREAVVKLSDILDGQPIVKVEHSCGAYAWVSLDTDPDSTNEITGRITEAGAEFATREATAARELRFRSSWTVPGTDWSCGTVMTVTPDQADPAHVRAVVKRAGQLQARVDERINRPGVAKHDGDYSRFAHAFVSHNHGATQMRVTPMHGGPEATFIIDGDRFSSAIVNTGFGAIQVRGDDLRQVTAGLSQQLWFATDDAHRPGAPEAPEVIEQRLLGF